MFGCLWPHNKMRIKRIVGNTYLSFSVPKIDAKYSAIVSRLRLKLGSSGRICNGTISVEEDRAK